MAITSETELVNLALSKIGAKRINDLDTDDSPRAVTCRELYAETRDSVLRSYWWRFATKRTVLSQDTETPAFEWGFQFILPEKFLRVKSLYDTSRPSDLGPNYPYAVEGDRLLTNQGDVNLIYIEQVTDVTRFDALFVEVLSTSLAVKLVMPLSQDKTLLERMESQLRRIMAKARVVDADETNTLGRFGHQTWLDSRSGRGIPTIGD